MTRRIPRPRPRFTGNPDDLKEFEVLAASPIRSPQRDAALRAWEEYKRGRQLATLSPEDRMFKGPGSAVQYDRVIDLRGATLDEICVGYADLRGVMFDGCSMRGTWLKGASLANASFRGADLTDGPGGRGPARLLRADLSGADFSGASLAGVDLSWTSLVRADLTGADLTGCNLEHSTLVGARLEGCRLTGAKVYGVSAWDLQGTPVDQSDLIITPVEQPPLSVDNLKLAQFIYLLLENREIRDVISTLTTKTVLILGRFTPRRKRALDTVREALRRLGYVPLVFDFTPSPNRDLAETVQLLANMARLVVADLTDARSLPQELAHIVPNLPSVPIQPIIRRSSEAYALFDHWRRFRSVLPEFVYRDERHLAASVQKHILEPSLAWR